MLTSRARHACAEFPGCDQAEVPPPCGHGRWSSSRQTANCKSLPRLLRSPQETTVTWLRSRAALRLISIWGQLPWCVCVTPARSRTRSRNRRPRNILELCLRIRFNPDGIGKLIGFGAKQRATEDGDRPAFDRELRKGQAAEHRPLKNLDVAKVRNSVSPL